jgi:hypothetical protein
MQLDHTAVVIRERGFFEILDLSLRMITRYTKPILRAWGLIAVPLMIANFLVLRSMLVDYDDIEDLVSYLRTMILFVTLQAPLVSILLTKYLGQAIFREESHWPALLRAAWTASLPLIWHVGILRATLFAWLLYLTVADRGAGIFMILFLVTAIAILVRALRPFIVEIILLEASPMRSNSQATPTIRNRSQALHNPNAGELAGRWLASAAVATGMFGSIVATYWFFSGMVLLNWNWGPLMTQVVIPLALWLTAGFLAVVRFFCYLDLRIRNEGWEVELLMRAAAMQFEEAFVQ